MRFETIFDQGSAEFAEDRHIVAFPFAMVCDGTSGVYEPRNGPMMFDCRTGGKATGGQMVCNELVQIIARAGPLDNCPDLLGLANAMVRSRLADAGLSASETDKTPGAAFALVKIGEKSIELYSCGDARVFGTCHSGETFSTENQCLQHETEIRAKFAEHLKRTTRDQAWWEIAPFLREKRKERVNTLGGYNLLNGQPEFDTASTRMTLLNFVPRHAVSFLLLSTDGFFGWDCNIDNAISILWKIKNESFRLRDVVNSTRGAEFLCRERSYTIHAEATAVAIWL